MFDFATLFFFDEWMLAKEINFILRIMKSSKKFLQIVMEVDGSWIFQAISFKKNMMFIL